jgi:very-short-patch-repair endonuclease
MPNSRPIDRFKRQTARRLRANAPETEVRLWRMLRQLPTYGTHFRRQVPIGPYVADFACLAARLVVELDGSQHSRDDHAARDKSRAEWLEREGYTVLRFWNNDLIHNPASVLESIYAMLYGSLHGEAVALKHDRRTRPTTDHPTPARSARPPSPGGGG